jgi:hypothetical protein
MKAHEFETIVNKLHMETKNTKHRHAYFVHNGVHVVKTMRSHGDSKYIPEHKIRKQLGVKEQFVGLYSCSVTKEMYIKILTDKGIITEDPHQPETSTGKTKSRHR